MQKIQKPHGSEHKESNLHCYWKFRDELVNVVWKIQLEKDTALTLRKTKGSTK